MFPELPLSSAVPICTTSLKSPSVGQHLTIPTVYHEFLDVFCPQQATQLPPYRSWDCTMELLPGVPLPHGQVYPLFLL